MRLNTAVYNAQHTFICIYLHVKQFYGIVYTNRTAAGNRALQGGFT